MVPRHGRRAAGPPRALTVLIGKAPGRSVPAPSGRAPPGVEGSSVSGQEERLVKRLERLIRAGDNATASFVAEELRSLYQRELDMLAQDGGAAAVTRTRQMELHLRLGEIHRTMGDDAAAVAALERVVRLGPDEVLAARAHQRLGELARLHADWVDAMRHYDRALAVLRHGDSHAELPAILRAKGSVHWRQQNFTQARRLMAEAKVEAQALHDDRELAAISIEMGNIANEEGDLEEAREHYNRAIETLKALEPSVQLARAYNNLGDTHIKARQWQAAIPFFEETLRISRRIRDKQWMGWGAFNAAECYAHVGQPMRAKEYCDLAMQLVTEKGDRIGIANTFANYGIAYRFLRQWDEMRRSFEEGIKRYEELGLHNVAAYTQRSYAEGLAEMGDRAAAMTWARKAADLYRRVGAERYAAETTAFLNELRESRSSES